MLLLIIIPYTMRIFVKTNLHGKDRNASEEHHRGSRDT